ncbi:MAG: hypothetical protein U0793_04580 [Gemmataceae bacterium]
MVEAKRIGQILIELQVLTPAEVERVLHAMRQRGYADKFGQVAKEMNLLRDEHILAALAVQMELFPRAAQMSLGAVLGKLSNPVVTLLQLPVTAARRKLRWQSGQTG